MSVILTTVVSHVTFQLPTLVMLDVMVDATVCLTMTVLHVSTTHTALFTVRAFVKHTTLELDASTILTTQNVIQSVVISDAPDLELMTV